MQAPRRSRTFPVATVSVGVVVLVVVALTAWLTLHFVVPDETRDIEAQSVADASAILAAKNAVEDRWPLAVSNFGKVFVHWEGDDAAVCGLVDLEEQDDAFAGMERFTYLEGQMMIEHVDGTAAVAQKWDDVCK